MHTPQARAVMDAVSFLPAEMRQAAVLKYSAGYQYWLLKGLPPLSGDQMRAVGHSAPDIEHAFYLYANGTLDGGLILK